MTLHPRIVRYSEAPGYCGMGQAMFDEVIRPLIALEIHYSSKFVGYDRVDLDDAIDEFKRRYGKSRGATTNLNQILETLSCQKNTQAYSTTKKQVNGASIKPSTEKESVSVYRQALRKKRK